MNEPTRYTLDENERLEKIQPQIQNVYWFVSAWTAHYGSLFITNKRIIFECTEKKKHTGQVGNSQYDLSIAHKIISHTEGQNKSFLSGAHLKIMTFKGSPGIYSEYKLIHMKNGKDLSDFLNKNYYNEENKKEYYKNQQKENRRREARTIESTAFTVLDYEKAISIWEEIGEHQESVRIKELIQNKIDLAKRHERLLEFDEVADIYKELGMDDELIRVRKLKAEQGAVKVTQKVVHGDEVTKTEIKDSVISKSNVGSGGDDKFTKLKELTEMKKEGLISDEEYEKMKQEIIG